MITALTARGRGPDSGALLSALGQAGLDAEPAAEVTTTVLDTFDGLLHAAGLRLDHQGGSLVLSGDDAVAAHLPVAATPRFAVDLPPGPFRDRVAAAVEVRALLPLLTVTTRCTRVVRRDGDGKIVARARVHEHLTTDHGDVGGWYVEVDELAGYRTQGGDLCDLVLAGGIDHVADGDVVDIAMAAVGVDAAGHRNEPSVPLDPDMPAIDGFRLVLANLARSIDDNRQGTVDDVDPEFLHDFRVAVRRTRSVLSHGERVLPAGVLAWSGDGFRSLARLTGEPRDLDVYVLEWDGYVAALPTDVVAALQPVRDQLAVDRRDAHRHLATALRDEEVSELLERWQAWLAQPPGAEAAPDGQRPVYAVVRGRIEKAQRRLVRHGQAITPATPAAEVHELRKDAKKLRYLLECFGGLLSASEGKAFVKRLKALQDNLGEHQDAEVHVAQLRRTVTELPATTDPATFVAIGQLIEQLDQRRQGARDEFATRFADYDSRKTDRALAAVLDGDRDE